MRVWCGIDWAERHHDICLVDENGTEPARRRVTDDVAGFTELAALLAGHGATSSEPVPVAIETAKGLVCAALRAAGYQLYPINPLAVSRYRDRYAVSRAKSDPGDASTWSPSPPPTARSPSDPRSPPASRPFCRR